MAPMAWGKRSWGHRPQPGREVAKGAAAPLCQSPPRSAVASIIGGSEAGGKAPKRARPALEAPARSSGPRTGGG
jgi:hypothetical protein